MVNTFNIPFFTNFFRPQNFYIATTIARFVHINTITYQLTIVFIGGYHKHFISCIVCLPSQCANYIICLIAFYTNYWNIKTFNNFFNIWYGQLYIFRSFLPIGFVKLIFFVTYCWATYIKTNS